MADYGLRIKDAVGSVILAITHIISRFRYSNVVSAGASSNTSLADIDGLSSVEISVMVNMTNWGYVEHSFVRSGTTVTWTAQSGTRYSSNDSAIFLFLYD
jgi:hypothetical protein